MNFQTEGRIEESFFGWSIDSGELVYYDGVS